MASKKKKQKKIALEARAHKATELIGSPRSLVVHSVLFVICFMLPLFGVDFDRVLLILTTAVSLEAIYLAIFIQMSVNKNTQDIEEIQEDVEEIQEDVEEIQEDVDEIQEDVDEIQKDVEEIEEDSEEDQKIEAKEAKAIVAIQTILTQLQKEIEQLKKK